MIRLLGLLLALLALVGPDNLRADDIPPAARMFERMRSLTGDWEGTFAWSDGRTGSGPLTANYYLTGNGSALVENLVMDGVPSMTSVYHLDGSDLRVTHYCAARNQPRFKARKIDESAGTVDFAFVDVTNVNPTRRAYVEAIALQLVDGDQVKVRFTFGGGPGMSGVENIQLKRMPPSHVQPEPPK